MEKIQDFLTSRTPITDSINVPNWLFVVLVVVLALLVIIIISATKNSKKTTVKEKTPIDNNPEVIPFLDEEKPQEASIKDNLEITFIQDVAVVSSLDTQENKPSALPDKTTPVDAVSRRSKLSQKSDSVENIDVFTSKEVVDDTPSAVTEEALATTEVAQEKPVVIVIDKPVETKKEAKIKTVEKNEEPVEVAEKTEKQVEGKFEICNSDLGGYRYLLRANNGHLLYESRDYKSVDSCRDAVDKFINAVKSSDFSVKADKFDRFKFILKSPTSNNSIYTGESFANNSACLSNIESVKRFALVSPIYDLTQEDYAAKSKVYIIPDEIKESVSNPNGAVGKWEIETEENNGKKVFIYLLYANNGQLLYESRDYASYASCKNGLETFIKTVRDGDFIIDPDKAGRYKFILRSKNKNSMVEYLGQNYSTHSAAESSAESVYKFALVSSLENL